MADLTDKELADRKKRIQSSWSLLAAMHERQIANSLTAHLAFGLAKAWHGGLRALLWYEVKYYARFKVGIWGVNLREWYRVKIRRMSLHDAETLEWGEGNCSCDLRLKIKELGE